jgi:hypothetical protein
LIYPGWDVTTLIQPKPVNLLLSERDDWFWKQNASSTGYAKMGIKELISRLGHYWLNNPQDVTKGIKGCPKFYSLE